MLRKLYCKVLQELARQLQLRKVDASSKSRSVLLTWNFMFVPQRIAHVLVYAPHTFCTRCYRTNLRASAAAVLNALLRAE